MLDPWRESSDALFTTKVDGPVELVPEFGRKRQAKQTKVSTDSAVVAELRIGNGVVKPALGFSESSQVQLAEPRLTDPAHA